MLEKPVRSLRITGLTRIRALRIAEHRLAEELSPDVPALVQPHVRPDVELRPASRGIAALRYAEHVGATVIATAGSPAKRQLLRLLGCRHVLDSRSLAFSDEVLEITESRGVDVVLNSVAGQALGRGVELLRPHGRFVELGKRDILADSPLGLRPFSRDLAFFGWTSPACCRTAAGSPGR
ncbi:zinc-binding dehydrogenase [Streptomyces sp. TS71-3]|uniref:zinc-binding dehydrogenase n=1 Tax=Streptomyces sp. TS71-3 TaxID=2733862 RepID=UPI001B23D337|nr:zinc-binding dehydrogenase [Streptomyces sp. TS71-3]GHJ37007.1 hypothetical protein Sm713_26160 [Streptomyces sp. TS71-3]